MSVSRRLHVAWFRRDHYATEVDGTECRWIVPQIMQLRELSTTGFAIAVAEEFIIISGVSVYAVLSQHYFLWMALFLAFGIHLLVHVGQFVLLRKYIPAIVTSLLCLPYAVYVCYFFYSTGLFTAMDFLLGGILGVLIMVLNLKLAHALGRRLDALIW